jgi:hypothetical protein
MRSLFFVSVALTLCGCGNAPQAQITQNATTPVAQSVPPQVFTQIACGNIYYLRAELVNSWNGTYTYTIFMLVNSQAALQAPGTYTFGTCTVVVDATNGVTEGNSQPSGW